MSVDHACQIINRRHTCNDCLCGLVVRVTGYRSRGTVPGTTRFPEKQWVWSGIHSASWVQLRSYLKKKKKSCSGPENRDYGRMDPSCWPRGTFYQQKLSLTSPTRGGRSVGIVRWLEPRSSVFSFSHTRNRLCFKTTDCKFAISSLRCDTVYSLKRIFQMNSLPPYSRSKRQLTTKIFFFLTLSLAIRITQIL
jgi:hypothetical protein